MPFPPFFDAHVPVDRLKKQAIHDIIAVPEGIVRIESYGIQ